MTTTVIDLSSEDEETNTITQNTRNATVKLCSQLQGNQSSMKIEMAKDFIDHVVMIWLHRVKIGYKNIQIPNNIIQVKAREAATVLGVQDILESEDWLSRFDDTKIRQMIKQGKALNMGERNGVIIIQEIIKEEKPKFLKQKTLSKNKILRSQIEMQISSSEAKTIEDEQKNHLSKVLNEQKKHLEQIKQAQIDRMKAQNHLKIKLCNQETLKEINLRNSENSPRVPGSIAAPAGDVLNIADVMKDPIQSYEEALECLGLVQSYLLSVRNMDAVLLADKIKDCLKNYT